MLPTLSEDSWVTDPLLTGDYLFAHFYVAEFNQSNTFSGHVSSLPYLVALNNNDLRVLCSQISSTLLTYFNRYFTNVNVSVTDVTPANKPSAGAISIYLDYTDSNGMTHTLSKLATVVNSKITKISNLNN
jgi:hypothetical protein